MIQEIPYAGWKRNLRIQGPTTELVITLDVGPRIIRYAFPDDKNVFVELPEQMGGSGEKEWMIRGGHRFWTAPEGDHSYELDNEPVTWKKLSAKRRWRSPSRRARRSVSRKRCAWNCWTTRWCGSRIC